MNSWIQESNQPVFQLFVAFLLLRRTERRTHDSVVRVSNPPYNIGVGLATQCGRIGQRRNVLAYILWLGVVTLELHPSRFPWKLTKLVQQASEVVVAVVSHHRRPFAKSISCPVSGAYSTWNVNRYRMGNGLAGAFTAAHSHQDAGQLLFWKQCRPVSVTCEPYARLLALTPLSGGRRTVAMGVSPVCGFATSPQAGHAMACPCAVCTASRAGGRSRCSPGAFTQRLFCRRLAL